MYTMYNYQMLCTMSTLRQYSKSTVLTHALTDAHSLFVFCIPGLIMAWAALLVCLNE